MLWNMRPCAATGAPLAQRDRERLPEHLVGPVRGHVDEHVAARRRGCDERGDELVELTGMDVFEDVETKRDVVGAVELHLHQLAETDALADRVRRAGRGRSC